MGDDAANGGKPRGDAVASSRQLTLQFGARSEAAPAATKSGVQLYMESIRATLLEEEPGLAEDQLVSRTVARFRALSQEERAVSLDLITRAQKSDVHPSRCNILPGWNTATTAARMSRAAELYSARAALLEKDGTAVQIRFHHMIF